MADGLLNGIRVVDLGIGLAAALVSKHLADAGAEVIRFEPPEGDPFHAIYPAYAVLRRGAGANGNTSEAIEQALADADICLVGGEDHPDIARRGDVHAIADRHPRLVVLDIAQGPAGTAYERRPSTELLAQARAGICWEQVPDRPVVNSFEPASYGAAIHGLLAVLAALYEREHSGRGQLVSTSLFEGVLAWLGMFWAQVERPTRATDYVLPKGGMPLIFRTKDGKFIHSSLGGVGFKYRMYQALGIDDPTVGPTDVSIPAPGSGLRHVYGDYDLMAARVIAMDGADVLEALWQQGLPAEYALDPGDCWSDAQVARNGIIAEDPDGTRHVGLPYLYGVAPQRAASRPATAPRRPLDGVRIVDCGAFIAGPLSGALLAEFGAEVIKVEPQGGDPLRAIWRQFETFNRGKRSIALDLKSEEGIDLIAKLCRGADVVMNNFRPGVSARLKIDPASLRQSNPDVITLESPAYGREGPMALKAGFDPVMQAWCGHEAKAAGEGNDPRWSRIPFVDYTGGMLGAVAVLTALVHRARTGQSVDLESPLLNASIFMLSELVQRPDGVFEGAARPNTGLDGYHPSEALYRAADGWVALVARGPAAALQLRERLGLDDVLPPDPAAWGDAAMASIGQKLAALRRAEIDDLLDGTGVWVAPCDDDMEARILNDSGMIGRGTVRILDHPNVGRVHELANCATFSRSPIGHDRPAPALGEHNDVVLRPLRDEHKTPAAVGP